MIIEFTKSFIETGLTVPAGDDRAEFCDSTVRGLVIQLNVKTKTEPRYQLRYKRNGVTKYDPLGSIRELTLTQARKLATQRKVEHAQEAKALPAVKPPLARWYLMPSGEITIILYANCIYGRPCAANSFIAYGSKINSETSDSQTCHVANFFNIRQSWQQPH